MSYLELLFKDKFMSPDTMDEIIYKFCTSHRIKSYVKKVEHVHGLNMGTEYDCDNYELRICHKNLMEDYEEFRSIFKVNEELFYNVYGFYTIIHELRHAYQMKMMSLDNNTLGDIYFIASGFLTEEQENSMNVNEHYDRNDDYYNLNRDICPVEKDACYYGYNYLKRVLFPIRDIVPRSYLFASYYSYLSLMEGYYECDSPFIKYVSERDGIMRLNELEWFDTDYDKCINKVSKLFSVKQRMSLGLPISGEELIKLDNKLLKLDKFL